MSEKLKAVRGNAGSPERILQWLKEHGATEYSVDYKFDNSTLYFVCPGGFVSSLLDSYAFLFDVEELPQWRAKQGERYYYITSEGLISAAIEDGNFDSGMRYNVGNYFPTFENAVPYKDKFTELLRKNRWK